MVIQNSSSTVFAMMSSRMSMTRGGSSPASSAAATRWAAMRAWAIICPSSVASSVRATFASEISPISAKLADSSSARCVAAPSASSRSAVAAL